MKSTTTNIIRIRGDYFEKDETGKIKKLYFFSPNVKMGINEISKHFMELIAEAKRNKKYYLAKKYEIKRQYALALIDQTCCIGRNRLATWDVYSKLKNVVVENYKQNFCVSKNWR